MYISFMSIRSPQLPSPRPPGRRQVPMLYRKWTARVWQCWSGRLSPLSPERYLMPSHWGLWVCLRDNSAADPLDKSLPGSWSKITLELSLLEENSEPPPPSLSSTHSPVNPVDAREVRKGCGLYSSMSAALPSIKGSMPVSLLCSHSCFPGLLRYYSHITYVSLRGMWRLDACVYGRMITTSSPSFNYDILWVAISLKIYCLDNRHVYNTVLLIIVTMLYVRSPEVIHLAAGNVSPLTHMSPLPNPWQPPLLTVSVSWSTCS